MDTTVFLSTILPEDGVTIVAINTPKGFRHKGFTDKAKAAEFALACDAKGLTTYHACAAYKNIPYQDENGKYVARVQSNWYRAKSFWFDVDCGEIKALEGKGYATKKEGAKALLSWFTAKGLPTPMLVDSGHGIHGYLVLDKAIDHTEWVRYAQRFKAVMAEDGVLVDPSRTADFASVLRPPGTHNHKSSPAPEVRVILEQKQFCTIEQITDVLGVEEDALGEAPDWVKDKEAQTIAIYESVPVSACACADKCKQVMWMRDTRGDCSYEHWRGVIGLIKHCTEGIELAYAWSERRQETGHSNCDVDTRYNTWGSGPPTCEFFQTNNPGGCDGCPFKGKIKSPIVLGREEPVQEASTADGVDEHSNEAKTYEVPGLPAGYEYKEGAMVRWVKNKDGVLVAQRFCRARLYLIGRIRNAEGTFEYLARAHLPDNRVREFTIPGSLAGAGGQKLIELLGANEVIIENNKDAVLNMGAYIRDAVVKLTESAEVTTTHTAFGWQSDGRFLLGTRLYAEDGSVSEALLSGYALDKRGCFPQPKGSLEGYAEKVNWIYNRPGMEPMQYFICSLWASPLVEFCETLYKGIPCAVTGASSGKGKTTAAMVALYAFGDASELYLAGSKGATVKAQAAFLGAMGSLPILFDEVTSMSGSTLSALCYALSNGVENMRLKSTSGRVGFSERESWRLQAGMTGNSHIGAVLAQEGNTEAEAMRVFEIRIDGYDVPQLDPIAVSAAVTAVERNAGVAGEEFIKFVTTHKSEVETMIIDSLSELASDEALCSKPKYRFFRSHMACTLTAAKIMKKLGVIEFDIDKLREFAIDAVNRIFEANEDLNNVDPTEMLGRMLADFSPRIISTPTYTVPDGTPFYQCPAPQGIVGREIRPTPDKRDEYAHQLFLKYRAVREWCVEKRVDLESFLRSNTANGVILDRGVRMRLGRCTNITAGRQRCIVIDTTKLDGD